MTIEELKILCEEQTRRDVDANIECDPNGVALDKSLCHSRLVATQVKYLQRALTKLPSYYAARCVIPSRAFEQSSGEAVACSKPISGESVLDLTCGLGVDSLALSRRFRRVVALERDEVLVALARENFRRLGVENIEVVHASAEGYLARCEERFDWVYADPDRRGADGSKRVLLEDCSPNILAVWSDLQRVSDCIAIKCSPIFDCDEAFRLFAGADVEVVSVGDECKEVVIYAPTSQTTKIEKIGATAIGRGTVWLDRAECVSKIEVVETESFASAKNNYTHLLIPDVSLQKGRIARCVLGEVCDIWSDNGYGFATDEQLAGYDLQRHLSRVFAIESIHEYEPRRLRRVLSERGIRRADILKRDSPYGVKQIASQLKITEGGVCQLVVTKVCGRVYMVILSGKK